MAERQLPDTIDPVTGQYLPKGLHYINGEIIGMSAKWRRIIHQHNVMYDRIEYCETDIDGYPIAADEHVAIKVEAFLEKYPSAEFGPGHVVLSDHNWDCIDYCLSEISKYEQGEGYLSDLPKDDGLVCHNDEVKVFLRDLKEIVNVEQRTPESD